MYSAIAPYLAQPDTLSLYAITCLTTFHLLPLPYVETAEATGLNIHLLPTITTDHHDLIYFHDLSLWIVILLILNAIYRYYTYNYSSLRMVDLPDT